MRKNRDSSANTIYNGGMSFAYRTFRMKQILPAIGFCVFLAGCGGVSAETRVTEQPAEPLTETAGGGTYDPPDMKTSEFHPDQAEGDTGAAIDVSCVNEGYVAVSAVSDKRLKFQVIKGEDTYNYDLRNNGIPSILPLQCGNGQYSFRIMENIVDKKYAVLFETTADVTLNSEFEPFLRPNDYVNYDKDSKCVKQAAELSARASGQLDVVTAVYDFICKNVKYDVKKAESTEKMYLPDPDETMTSGKGICFDYASLAASMLRSQGIPTKVIFGYVSPDDLYHAWNMFYTEETGWVTAEFRVDTKTWTRLDLTFSANGSDAKFIGDGSNYTDLYQY